MDTPMTKQMKVGSFSEPPLARFLFADTRVAWLWLILRLYVGWQWLSAGWEKATSDAWIGANAGTSLYGFISGAISKATGAHPAVSGWYAAFLNAVVLPHTVFFSYLVTMGELAVGIALIVGMFAGIAAFFGAFMNMNFLFAGAVSINPILFLCELFLILAWRIAGWWGLDRTILPALGTPWEPGEAFQKSA